MRPPVRLGLIALLLGISGCDGTEGALTSLATPSPTPSPTPVPLAVRSTPQPVVFGTASPINTNAGATNGPPMTGNSNPAAPSLPRDTSEQPPASYTMEVVPALRSYCLSCHAPGGSGYAALALFDDFGRTDYTTVRSNINRIISSISAGRMPPTDDQVPLPQLDKIRSWLQDGASLN